MSVGLYSIDQNNAAPLQEASRNPDGRRVVDKAKWFRLCGHQHTGNPVAHGRYDDCPLPYVRGPWRDRWIAKPISRVIIFPSASEKQEPWQRQAIQSHQKKRSMLSSSKSQSISSNEKPYFAGQLFARP